MLSPVTIRSMRREHLVKRREGYGRLAQFVTSKRSRKMYASWAAQAARELERRRLARSATMLSAKP